MPLSLEHTASFHLARRLARVIAPEYRVISTSELKRGSYVLDVYRKTIEISEEARGFEAVAMILFSAGHLRFRYDPLYSDHFGKIKVRNKASAIRLLVQQGVDLDKKAAEWAYDVMVSNFNIDPVSAERQLNQLRWDEVDWDDYYRSEFENINS